jgi:UDP-glucuronate 4-epimerase
LRLFNVYGPRLRPELALSVFTSAILRGEKLPLFGDGSVRRDFASVHDVVAGIEAALTAENVAGEIINLGNHNPVTVMDVIRFIETAAGKTAILDRQPARPEEMPLTYADIRKAQGLLGFEPRVPIAAGIAEFVAWWRAEQQ